MALVMDKPRTSHRQQQPEALRALMQRVVQRAADAWQEREFTCTPRQYDVLAAGSANTGVSQHRLMLETGIDRSTMADIVKRLAKKGLLNRKRTKEDARAYAVTLTSEGTKALREMSSVSRDVDKAISKELSASEVATLRRLLERMVSTDQRAADAA